MLWISGRRIGRCCEFLEDVSEDVDFIWKNLADVKISKKNYLILISLINISQEFPIKVYVFRYVFQEITASSDLTLRDSHPLQEESRCPNMYFLVVFPMCVFVQNLSAHL